MIEWLKILLWTIRYFPEYKLRYFMTKSERQKLNILTSLQTLQLIVDKKMSVSRFGDGELQMMDHYTKSGSVEDFNVDTFQSFVPELGKKLWDVFLSTDSNLLVCLPFQFKQSNVSSLRAQLFWEREWLGRRTMLSDNLTKRVFGDTNFTRFYLSRRDIVNYEAYISLLKSIWNARDVVLVEGALSRLGVGNDIFENTTLIERVICPAKNAFEKYNDIITFVKSNVKQDKLILIALGHAATVMACDLAKMGYQAIDIGHVDIEYEWFRMRAKRKVPIKNKYVNEVDSGRITEAATDKHYLSQVIKFF